MGFGRGDVKTDANAAHLDLDPAPKIDELKVPIWRVVVNGMLRS